MGSQLPGQALDMNPPAGKPHSGVIVKVSRGGEFVGEVIHDIGRALPVHASFGPLPHFSEGFVVLDVL